MHRIYGGGGFFQELMHVAGLPVVLHSRAEIDARNSEVAFFGRSIYSTVVMLHSRDISLYYCPPGTHYFTTIVRSTNLLG